MRRTQSALLVAGAAAGAVAAATWMGRRRPRVVPLPHTHSDLVEPDRAELPLGSSADPDIDQALSRQREPRQREPQAGTSGGALLGEVMAQKEPDVGDASLEDVWNAMPGLVGGEQTEGYDAVEPEDLGAVWLERATQTTHDERPRVSDPNDVPNLDALTVSEGSRTAALSLDDDELTDKDELTDEDEPTEDEPTEDEPTDEDEAIADDELDHVTDERGERR